VDKCKGTVASGDVFEAETIGWYLKLQSEEVDASGSAKGTTINGRRSAASLMPKRIRRWATEGRKSEGSLNKSHVFRLN